MANTVSAALITLHYQDKFIATYDSIGKAAAVNRIDGIMATLYEAIFGKFNNKQLILV